MSISLTRVLFCPYTPSVPRLLRVVVPLFCLLLAGGLVAGVTAIPATATSTLLCKGYAGCRALNMSDGGYEAAGASMWWRMYAGHNCTNYAAYRMVRSGMPNVRPWSGGGNASNWGPANPDLTNSVPKVGAVAWWAANVRPAGSSGHVAYVERVVSADEIVVSQDSWGGDFSWARTTRVGGNWPSGFIHFNDVPLMNTSRPTVSGVPRVGAVLSASPGSWTPSAASYKYQWRAGRVDIANADGPSLRLRLAQQGKKISVRITAARLGYPTTSATSARTPAVEPKLITNTSPPTISGDAKVGSRLTASPGAWTPAPTALAYQWTADDTPITGATSPTLTPRRALLGRALSVMVTASRDGYADVSSTSARTAPVAEGSFSVTSPATVSGAPRPGDTLTFDPGGFRPGNATVSVQWLRAGARIEGATGSTYQLTTADLGSRIAARATLTKRGYTALSTRTPLQRRVKSAPTMKVQAQPGRGQLRVTAGVTADGVEPVSGTILIKSGGAVVRQLTLHEGAAATTLKGLPKGTQSFAMRYTGSRTVTATAVRRTVRIG